MIMQHATQTKAEALRGGSDVLTRDPGGKGAAPAQRIGPGCVCCGHAWL